MLMASIQVPLLTELGRATRRRWPVALAVALVVVALVGAASWLQPRTYTVTANLLFRDPGFDQQLAGVSILRVEDEERAAATNLRLVSLPAVANRTADDPGVPMSADEVEDAIKIVPQGQSDIVAVEATAKNPEEAALVANAFAENYIEFRREADRQRIADARRLVEREVEDLQNQGEVAAARSLRREASSLRAIEALQTGNAELVQRADPTAATTEPNMRRNLIVGGTIGLLLGVLAAVAVHRADRRFTSVDAARDRLGYPVLTVVPRTPGLDKPFNTPRGLEVVSADHAFAMLRTQLRYFNADRRVQSVLITSGAPAEGKSTVACGLAAASSRMGEPVVLIEADLRRPSLAGRLGVESIPGLAEYLSGQVELDEALRPLLPGTPGGSSAKINDGAVLMAGASPPNPQVLLESQRMRELLDELSTRYSLLVIDTPPALGVPDALPLMKAVDGVMLVIDLDSTSEAEAYELQHQLTQLKAPILGMVINRARKATSYDAYVYEQYGSSRS